MSTNSPANIEALVRQAMADIQKKMPKKLSDPLLVQMAIMNVKRNNREISLSLQEESALKERILQSLSESSSTISPALAEPPRAEEPSLEQVIRQLMDEMRSRMQIKMTPEQREVFFFRRAITLYQQQTHQTLEKAAIESLRVKLNIPQVSNQVAVKKMSSEGEGRSPSPQRSASPARAGSPQRRAPDEGPTAARVTPLSTVAPAGRSPQAKAVNKMAPLAKVAPINVPSQKTGATVVSGSPIVPRAKMVPLSPGSKRPLPDPAMAQKKLAAEASQKLQQRKDSLPQKAGEVQVPLRKDSKSIPPVPLLVIADMVAKNSPAWLVYEDKPKIAEGAKKMTVVRAIGDFIIDKFSMDLSRGFSYAYKSENVQGLTSTSDTQTLFGSMAPDQYYLMLAQKLDENAIDRLVIIGVDLHYDAEIEKGIEFLLKQRMDEKVSNIYSQFSMDEMLIKAKIDLSIKSGAPISREIALQQIKAEIENSFTDKQKKTMRDEIIKSVSLMETVKSRAERIVESGLREKLKSQLSEIKLNEITNDPQVEKILKGSPSQKLTRAQQLTIADILQQWIGNKHIHKVADEVAGQNKAYAVLSITGGGQREVRGFGIHESSVAQFRSKETVEYDKLTRPSVAVYAGHHPRIVKQMTIQSGGKLNNITGKLNIGAEDLTAILNFYQDTMGKKPPVPLVVNCTDGVDRTGMIMTALVILDQFNKQNDITTKPVLDQQEQLLNIIENLRKDRGPYFLRGTADIAIAITLGYSLIAKQKQIQYQVSLNGVEKHPAISALLAKAQTMSSAELKEQIQQLIKRQDLGKDDIDILLRWSSLVGETHEFYNNFQAANDVNGNFHERIGKVLRHSDADGEQARSMSFFPPNPTNLLVEKGFYPRLLQKIKPLEAKDTLLERIYERRGALGVFSTFDFTERRFEDFCKKEIGEQDEAKILAAKMLALADILLEKKAAIGEDKTPYLEALKEAVQKASESKMALATLKHRDVREALFQGHRHQLREIPDKFFKNLAHLKKVHAEFKNSKAFIMQQNPLMTEERYAAYLQKLGSVVEMYEQKVKLLSQNDMLILEKIRQGVSISLPEYLRATEALAELLTFKEKDVEPLTDITSIYYSLQTIEGFDFIVSGRLSGADYLQMAQGPRSHVEFLKTLEKDRAKVMVTLGQENDPFAKKIAALRKQEQTTMLEANENIRFQLIDSHMVKGLSDFAQIVGKSKLGADHKGIVEQFVRELKNYMVANNNEYLNPSPDNLLKFKQASLALGGAYASFERRKAEVLYFINEDPKIQKAIAESNVKYLEVLESALKAGAELFSSISVRNPSQRGASQRGSEVQAQERGSERNSAPKAFVPGRRADAVQRDQILGQARRGASPHRPFRPSVQEGVKAQPLSPQSKLPEDEPPKGRSPSPKKSS